VSGSGRGARSSASQSLSSTAPDKDPVTRAKANLLAFQFENVTLPPFLQLAESSTGDDKSIQAFLSAVKALNPYLDDEVVNTTEYGLGDILIAPLLVGVTGRIALGKD
jgi:hypothetical protein